MEMLTSCWSLCSAAELTVGRRRRVFACCSCWSPAKTRTTTPSPQGLLGNRVLQGRCRLSLSGRLPPAAPLRIGRVKATCGRSQQRAGNFGAELHCLLLVQVVQDGVPGPPPHLGPPPPGYKHADGIRTGSVYGLAEGPVYGLAGSPLAAADEGPADGQDGNGRQEAGQDDVEHPPL